MTGPPRDSLFCIFRELVAVRSSLYSSDAYECLAMEALTYSWRWLVCKMIWNLIKIDQKVLVVRFVTWDEVPKKNLSLTPKKGSNWSKSTPTEVGGNIAALEEEGNRIAQSSSKLVCLGFKTRRLVFFIGNCKWACYIWRVTDGRSSLCLAADDINFRYSMMF